MKGAASFAAVCVCGTVPALAICCPKSSGRSSPSVQFNMHLGPSPSQRV